MMAADVQRVTLLAMLDLSAAFDCVDHTILLQRLQIGAGLTDVVLEWIASFLSERTQRNAYGGEVSSIQLVLFGVPQGSVLGPLLYVLYTAGLFDVVTCHRLHLTTAECTQRASQQRHRWRALPTSTTRWRPADCV